MTRRLARAVMFVPKCILGAAVILWLARNWTEA